MKDIFQHSKIHGLYLPNQFGRSVVMPNNFWNYTYKNLYIIKQAGTYSPVMYKYKIYPEIIFKRKYNKSDIDCVILPKNLSGMVHLTNDQVQAITDAYLGKIPAVHYLTYFLSEKKREDLTYETLSQIAEMCNSKDTEVVKLGLVLIFQYSPSKYIGIQAYLYNLRRSYSPINYSTECFLKTLPNGMSIREYSLKVSNRIDIALYDKLISKFGKTIKIILDM